MDAEKIRTLQQTQLAAMIRQEIPDKWEWIACNLAKMDRSAYVLLRGTKQQIWLTLRVADHPLWLKSAQQLTVNIGNPADFLGMAKKIRQSFSADEVAGKAYHLTVEEVVLLQLVFRLQQKGMVFAVHLEAEIFLAFKAQSLDLQTDFKAADLFLTHRNNVNKVKIPILNPAFQQTLAILFGRNLLFSQFSRQRLLKLLPTNQWIQPILAEEKTCWNWKEKIIACFGQNFYDSCQKWL